MQNWQKRAAAGLRSLYPTMGPWTAAALWHGCGPAVPPPTSPLSDELDDIVGHRLAALLLRYAADTGVVLDPEHRTMLQQAAFAWTQRAFAAMNGAQDVVAELLRRGTAVAVSKGPGVARFYPSPECRPYSDLDLIVAPRRFTRTMRYLEASGWYEETRNQQPWPYFRRWCREGLNLIDSGGTGAVDLHHQVPPWVWSTRLDKAGMAARAEEVHAGPRAFPCLTAADNLLLVALHLISDHNAPGKTLIVWRDLAELAAAAPVAQVVERARAAELTGWLAAVLDAAPRLPSLVALRAHLPSDARIPHAIRLGLLLSPRSARYGVTGTQVLRLPLLNGLVFLLGMAVPSRGFLAQKYPDTKRRYRRWWSNSRTRLGT